MSLGKFTTSKALPLILPLYFQLPYLPEETCFQQGGSSAVEGTSQAVRDRLTSGRYQPACHYFV
jgi:hypothetical protein